MVLDSIGYKGVDNLMYINYLLTEQGYLIILELNLIRVSLKFNIQQELYLYQENTSKYKS